MVLPPFVRVHLCTRTCRQSTCMLLWPARTLGPEQNSACAVRHTRQQASTSMSTPSLRSVDRDATANQPARLAGNWLLDVDGPNDTNHDGNRMCHRRGPTHT